MTTPGPDPLIGTVIADRYQILEELGEGGMGRVYLAEHLRMGRRSALKVMSPNLALAADAISRFHREAANASRINHPNVAQIYDFGETSDGMLYLAMEYVEGETLRAALEREARIPVARAAQLTSQIAAALAAAHHLGIVHRDLKPDNIMIARHHDGSDWVKVVDFGIAKTVQGSGDPGAGSQTVTTVGVSLGTPEYMSPEQLAGERLDHRTDLYSLGLVAFHMLTGDLPYPRVTSRDTLVKRLTSPPHTLAEIAPDIAWPARLQRAMDRALAPHAAGRYESVIGFARDVADAVADYPAAKTGAHQSPGPTQRFAAVAAVATGNDAGTSVPAVPPHDRVPTRRLAEAAPRSRRTLWAGAVVAAIGAVGGAVFIAVPRRNAPQSLPQVQPSAQPPAAVNVVKVVPETVRVEVPVARAPAPREPSPDVQQAAVPAASVAGAGTHAWLRANGDSGEARPLGASASDGDRVRYLVQEIRGHAARASMMLKKGNFGGARTELRDLAFETQTAHALYPAAADSLRLDQQVRFAGMRLIQECRGVIADSTRRVPPNFACEQLVPGGGRGRQNAGARAGTNQRPWR